MFDEFHVSTEISTAILSYFVALIPKIDSLQTPTNFQPISLLGCLYKLIDKVLSLRLKKVVNSLVSENQCAFLKDRNIVEGPIIINEVLDFAKKSKKGCLVFQGRFRESLRFCQLGLSYLYAEEI